MEDRQLLGPQEPPVAPQEPVSSRIGHDQEFGEKPATRTRNWPGSGLARNRDQDVRDQDYANDFGRETL